MYSIFNSVIRFRLRTAVFLRCLLFFILPLYTQSFSFKDVSKEAGLKRILGRGRRKYGGASVADYDGDGWPDLLLGHHNDRHAELYFNNRNGKFMKSKWQAWNDTHALTPFRFSVRFRNLHFLLSRGGQRGKMPSSPAVLRVSTSRMVANISRTAGFTGITGRGRSAIFINLRRNHYRYAHVLILNAALDPTKDNIKIHYAFEGLRSPSLKFKEQPIPGFENSNNPYGGVADVNGDGFMEVLTWHTLKMHKLIAPFKMRDISNNVFPVHMRRFGVVAVAELDYDNDGRWDLYVARTDTSDLKYLKGRDVGDYLLRNVGGRYIDVSRVSGIPRGIRDTRGVTTGDFDNDGWIDILVTRHRHPDYILRNKGDGTFEIVNARFYRKRHIRGDMATSVDYNKDGKLDVILSEGDYFDIKHGGYYRIMKNVMESRNNFILVTVRNAPGYKATSLHAVVTVQINVKTGDTNVQRIRKSMTMYRRVGSPGTAVSISYIETVHFGLGDQNFARLVSVRWIDGTVRTLEFIRAGSKLVFGPA